MSQHLMHTDIPAKRIGEPGDAWRCSLCNGYVRGNASRCKHCHAIFGAPEPFRPDADGLSSSDIQLNVSAKSASYFLQVVLSWCVVGYLIYLCWNAGTTIDGYAGIAVGSILFVTILTPLLCLWLYTHHPLPKPTARTYGYDLVFVWVTLSVTIALPSIAYFSVLEATRSWWRVPLGVTLSGTLVGFGLFHLRLWKWTGRSEIGERWGTALESSKSKSLPRIWIEVLCQAALPYTVYVWSVTHLPEPYSSVARFVWLTWLLLLTQERLRTWIHKQLMHVWQRWGATEAHR